MLYNILYLFLLFYIYSILGWVTEVLNTLYFTHKFVNRGLLLGPYCPIYGFGALILLLLLPRFENNPLCLYIVFAIFASVLEYIASYLMEKIFNLRWWDYSNRRFNLHGRIALKNILLFGMLGLLLAYFINPFIVFLLSFIPNPVLYYVSIILALSFIVDLVLTFNIILKLKNNIISLKKDATEEVDKQIANFIIHSRLAKAFPLICQKIWEITLKND